MLYPWIALGVIACVCPVGVAQVVLIEDFEEPVTSNFITFDIGQTITTSFNDWLVTGGSIDVFNDAARPEAVAFDGAQAIDMAGTPGMGQLETPFDTTPGRWYELVFYYARNDFLGGTVGAARVEVIGAAGGLVDETITHDPANNVFSDQFEFRTLFRADQTSSTLRFTSLNDGVAGITIDAISIGDGCPADLDAPFGQVDIFDVILFLALFDAEDPGADLAAPFGTWDVFDVLEYLTLFDQGCP